MPIENIKQLVQGSIGKLFSRENPFFTRNKHTWERSLDAYAGGRAYIVKALIKHLAEVKEEYDERLQRAYYINYPKKLVKLIVGHLLGKAPSRDGADEELVKDWSRTGLSTDDVMRQFAAYVEICGCAWLVVDMPTFEGTVTKEQEQRLRLRPYCLALSPLSVVDWSYGGDGKLDWVLTREHYLDDSDPFKDPVRVEVRKLWTRDEVVVIKRRELSDYEVSEPVQHGLGVVPFVRHIEPDGYGISHSHWFEDAVRISDAILNAESEAQMNIIKQMYGQLVIGFDMLDHVEAQAKKLAEMTGGTGPLSTAAILARSAALFETNESKGISRYISPDGANTETITAENARLKRELVEVVGLALSQDGDAAQSGISKEWDFQNMAATFGTLAGQIESCEDAAWDLMTKWSPNLKRPDLSYNRIFGILDLKTLVDALMQIKGFATGKPEFERAVDKAALSTLQKVQQLPQDVLETIHKEIDNADYSLGGGSALDMAGGDTGNGVDNPGSSIGGVASAGT